ncbi:MAG: metallophosphoesterase family protein [Leptospirales bacterium]
MRSICWLHISDIHMRVIDAWSHDVVLKAMCEDMVRRRGHGVSPDFILATGDLAFSGKMEEYKLVESFFDALSTASGVPKERIFCIPGNHDIDRNRQKMCFVGARQFAQSQNEIDHLLSSPEDMETLLRREDSYRKFQSSYLEGQSKEWTEDGLGYVSIVSIDYIRLAIIGLDSSWLAEGGLSDTGKLLIGERQVINALKIAERNDPHIIISMAHHPFQLLQDFDRRPVQNRIERMCHFFQYGHFHEPEVRTAGLKASGCLMLSVGAAFETRQSINTYSIVSLDLMYGKRIITTIQFQPAKGEFGPESSEEYPIEIEPSGACNVYELAEAITAYDRALSPLAHYLAALLLDQKTDMLIVGQGKYAFGSYAVVKEQPESTLKNATMKFMPFKNVLRVYYKRLPLSDILNRFGDAVARYGATLEEASKGNGELKSRLGALEQDARAIAKTIPQSAFSHTVMLLKDIAADQDWTQLRVQSERHLDSTDAELASKAKRFLALALSHSGEAAERARSISLYQSIVEEENAELSDVAILATLLIGTRRYEEAKHAVLGGIAKFPDRGAAFSEIGQRIVEATEDREFRDQMAQAVKVRRK